MDAYEQEQADATMRDRYVENPAVLPEDEDEDAPECDCDNEPYHLPTCARLR